MNQKEIMVSIVCITYNHEKYIKDALEGFLSQKTDFSYEVIVHDDASTDHTADILREYEQKYPNIIKPVYQTENQFSKLRLQGKAVIMSCLPLIKGKYVATCEGDDYWIDCYKLQKQVDFLEKNPDYVACVHNTKIDDLITPAEATCQFRVINSSTKPYDITFSEAVQNGSGTVCQTSSFFCRGQYYRTIYSDPRPDFFYKAKGFGDWAVIIYLLLNGKVRYLPDIMSVYRYGVEGSYTLQMRNTTESIKEKKILLEFIEAVNEYTNFQYSSVLYSAHKIYKFQLAILTKDYDTVRKKENHNLWAALSRKGKIKIFLECKIPILFKLYKIIKDKKHG